MALAPSSKMASRRLVTHFTKSSPSSTPLTRCLSTSQCLRRAPALSDIQPGKQETFDTKQREFREELAARTRRQREIERMQSQNASKSTSTAESTLSSVSASSSSYSNNAMGEGLGSLSTAAGEAARKADEVANKRKPSSGRFSNLIYGTEEGREMDRDIERSFSQVLARGKYVHSIVFHEVKPDKVDEYVELVGSWYPRVAQTEDHHVNLVGSWRTEVGDCDTFSTF